MARRSEGATHANATIPRFELADRVASGGTPAHICDNTPNSQCVAQDATLHVWNTCNTDIAAATSWSMSNYNSVAPPAHFVLDPAAGCFGPPVDEDVTIQLINSASTHAFAWGQCRTGATYGGSEASHNRWCDPEDLYWNTAYSSAYPTVANKRYIACHELGHMLGLRHSVESGSVSCMKIAQFSPPVLPTATTTSSHDRGEIASHY